MKRYWPRGLATHLVRHPRDVLPVASAAWRVRRSRWWANAPFLPVPDEAYWRFRMTTAYGDENASPSAADVVAAARWSRRHGRVK